MNKLHAYPNNNLSNILSGIRVNFNKRDSTTVQLEGYTKGNVDGINIQATKDGKFYASGKFDGTWNSSVGLATKDDLGIYFTAAGSKAAIYKQNVISVSIQLKAGHTYFLVGKNGVSISNDGPMSATFDVLSDAGSIFHLENSRTTMSNGGGCVTAMIIKTVKDCTVNLIGYGYVNETYNYEGRIIAIQLT